MTLREIKIPNITMQILPIPSTPLHLMIHRKTKVGMRDLIKPMNLQKFMIRGSMYFSRCAEGFYIHSQHFFSRAFGRHQFSGER